jgi:hypothetical protein
MASVAAIIAPANLVMPQKTGPQQPMLLIETVTLKLKIAIIREMQQCLYDDGLLANEMESCPL